LARTARTSSEKGIVMTAPKAWLLAIALSAWAAPAFAALNVFATVPEWGALAEELGGDKVKVYTATNALQDPHHVEAKPSLIARARAADLVVATGAELEIGWLPLVTQQAGNPRVQAGKPGYFEAAPLVPMVEKPTRLDRAEGDVHALGNPHIQTDARNIARVAGPLSARLAEIDPSNAAYYQARYKAFAERWSAAIARWERAAVPLKGVAVLVQHKGFPYLLDWLGMKEIAALEPKPGVEPTIAHLSEILETVQRQPVKMVIRAAYQSDRASQWIAERARINAVVLPFTVGGDDAAKDLFSLFDDTVQRLLKGAQ
jgi:zinc/manganese transport system substrate-binding protein